MKKDGVKQHATRPAPGGRTHLHPDMIDREELQTK